MKTFINYLMVSLLSVTLTALVLIVKNNNTVSSLNLEIATLKTSNDILTGEINKASQRISQQSDYIENLETTIKSNQSLHNSAMNIEKGKVIVREMKVRELQNRLNQAIIPERTSGEVVQRRTPWIHEAYVTVAGWFK